MTDLTPFALRATAGRLLLRGCVAIHFLRRGIRDLSTQQLNRRR